MTSTTNTIEEDSNQIVNEGCLTNISADGRSLFRSTIQSLIYARGGNGHLRNARSFGKQSKMRSELTELLIDCDVFRPRDSYSLDIFGALIENSLNRRHPEMQPFRLIVTSTRSINDTFLYPTRDINYEETPKTNLVLYRNSQGHYIAVIKPNKFFRCSRICFSCKSAFTTLARHNANCCEKCRYCGQRGSVVPCPDDQSAEIQCEACNTRFFNRKCFKKHKTSMCAQIHTCLRCGQRYAIRIGKHVCGHRWCSRCHSYHQADRGCFVTKIKPPIASAKFKMCVFDFECRQQSESRPGVFLHEPNFAALSVTCDSCIDSGEWRSKTCQKCENEEGYFSQVHDANCNPAKELLAFIKRITAPGATTIAISHFGEF